MVSKYKYPRLSLEAPWNRGKIIGLDVKTIWVWLLIWKQVGSRDQLIYFISFLVINCCVKNGTETKRLKTTTILLSRDFVGQGFEWVQLVLLQLRVALSVPLYSCGGWAATGGWGVSWLGPMQEPQGLVGPSLRRSRTSCLSHSFHPGRHKVQPKLQKKGIWHPLLIYHNSSEPVKPTPGELVWRCNETVP